MEIARDMLPLNFASQVELTTAGLAAVPEVVDVALGSSTENELSKLNRAVFK